MDCESGCNLRGGFRVSYDYSATRTGSTLRLTYCRRHALFMLMWNRYVVEMRRNG